MKQDLLVNTGEAEVSKERTGEAAASVSEIITDMSRLLLGRFYSLSDAEKEPKWPTDLEWSELSAECRVEPKHWAFGPLAPLRAPMLSPDFFLL